MEKIKSKLQKNLEDQGWELLTNENPLKKDIYELGVYSRRNRLIPQSDREIKEKYLKRTFKEVTIQNAYDFQGNLISELRAVYVK